MGSTSSAAFLWGDRCHQEPLVTRAPGPSPPPTWLPHFLAVTAFCRFQSLSVPSSDAVSRADWLWWKARERMPS